MRFVGFEFGVQDLPRLSSSAWNRDPSSLVGPDPISVPHYRTWHSRRVGYSGVTGQQPARPEAWHTRPGRSTRYVSTGHRIVVDASLVPDTAYRHTIA
eukprot:2598580-Rhodomonas_salina.3